MISQTRRDDVLISTWQLYYPRLHLFHEADQIVCTLNELFTLWCCPTLQFTHPKLFNYYVSVSSQTITCHEFVSIRNIAISSLSERTSLLRSLMMYVC